MAIVDTRMPVAERTLEFTESVIREMTRLINLHHPDDGINLAQGFPDFSAPLEIKEAAANAILADINQYGVTWGSKPFREGIAAKTERFYGYSPDPETEVTVCCGSTEGMIATMMAVVNPGDEVIIFEPFYENYGPDSILCGAKPVFVRLDPPEWELDRDLLEKSFSNNTRAIIVNTPNNPTGKVFSRDELTFIAELCHRYDALAITDEIYEHIVYDGLVHTPMATLPGMRERTITVNGMSKTFSVTGWRIGYVIAPTELTSAIRKVHDFLTVGAPAPLQVGGVAAMELPQSYYDLLLEEYAERREFILPALRACGLPLYEPKGAYYAMADISGFGFADDVSFTNWLVTDLGVAVVPGSSFYRNPKDGSKLVRFAFPKRMSTLEKAANRLRDLPARLSSRN